MKNANFKRRTNDRKIVRGLMKKKELRLMKWQGAQAIPTRRTSLAY